MLDRDVVDCDHHGIRLAPFAKLDCAGHEIRAREGGATGYGVRLDAIEQAEVRNCKISGFHRGIRIRGGHRNGVIANEIVGGVYGIEVAGQTDGGRSEENRVSGNRIVGPERDGIHVGAGTAHTLIESNSITAAGEEGITVEACRACELIGNTIDGNAGAAIDINDSTGGRYARNTVRGSLVKIRGSSERNLFEDNDLSESGYVFSATPGASAEDADRVPTRNRVVGGVVRDSAVCFRFRGARDNVIVDVETSNCQLRHDQAVGSLESAGNRLSDTGEAPQ